MDTHDLKILAPISPSSLNAPNRIPLTKTSLFLNTESKTNNTHLAGAELEALPTFKKTVFTKECFTFSPKNNNKQEEDEPLLSSRSSPISSLVSPTRPDHESSHTCRCSITRCYMFPTSAPLFPTTFIPNYVVINPEQQDAIVFCGNYNLKIGLFYVKDINWDSNDSITSPCDIYSRGVLANITGYKFIQDIGKSTSGKNIRKLIVNLRILYNVEIDEKNFWIPKAYSSMNQRKKSSVDSSFTKNDTSWMTDASLVGDFDPNISSISNKNGSSRCYNSFHKEMNLLTNLIDKDRTENHNMGESDESHCHLLDSHRLKEDYIKHYNTFANLITVTTKISKKEAKDLGITIRELSDRIYRLYEISKKLKAMKLFISNSRQKMAFCNAYIYVKNFRKEKEYSETRTCPTQGPDNRSKPNTQNEEDDSATINENNCDPEYLVFKFYAVVDILKMFFGYLFANDISRLRFFMGVFQDINDKKLLSERVTQALKLTDLAINVLNLRDRQH